jgi:hypothetical protein
VCQLKVLFSQSSKYANLIQRTGEVNEQLTFTGLLSSSLPFGTPYIRRTYCVMCSVSLMLEQVWQLETYGETVHFHRHMQEQDINRNKTEVSGLINRFFI